MNAPHLEARRWFQEAQADLAVVRTLRGAGHHAAACFHSQQAAEKALKALLYARAPASCSGIPYVIWRASVAARWRACGFERSSHQAVRRLGGSP